MLGGPQQPLSVSFLTNLTRALLSQPCIVYQGRNASLVSVGCCLSVGESGNTMGTGDRCVASHGVAPLSLGFEIEAYL